MSNPGTIPVCLFLLACLAGQPGFAQVDGYKDFPQKRLNYSNNTSQCGYYDEANKRLYDCKGNLQQIVNVVTSIDDYDYCCVKNLHDMDGDNVSDEEDKCPNAPGPESNFGCPVIDEGIIQQVSAASKNILFATGSAILMPRSFKPLDNIVELLQKHPELRMTISAHTDNTGSDEVNQVLSESRAQAVRSYLASKGILESRLTAIGYGETKPVASNNTAAGRARNRRVELSVSDN